MAKEVQLDKVSRDEVGSLEGYVQRDKREPLRPVFDPVRRKLHIQAE